MQTRIDGTYRTRKLRPAEVSSILRHCDPPEQLAIVADVVYGIVEEAEMKVRASHQIASMGTVARYCRFWLDGADADDSLWG